MLKEILGVKENFKLPTALLKELLQDSETIIEKIKEIELLEEQIRMEKRVKKAYMSHLFP